MSYSHVLVAVAVTPESYRLITRAVSIVKPVNGKNLSYYYRHGSGTL
ncbi:universal stress protein UspC [Cronobacter sakazakii]|nr:universal stress protein UspC [Cronobacter sakazakii]